jgi:hypothetical protein
VARRYMKPVEDTAICSYLVGLYLFFSFSHQVPAMAEGFSGTRNDPAVSQTFSRAKLLGGEYETANVFLLCLPRFRFFYSGCDFTNVCRRLRTIWR